MSVDLPAAMGVGPPVPIADARRPAPAWLLAAAVHGAWALVLVLWAGTAIVVAPSAVSLVAFAAAFAAFTAPGWPLARWLAGCVAGWVFLAPLALVLGYAAGVSIYLLLRLAGLTTPLVVGAATIAVAVALRALLRPADVGLLPLPAADRRDAAALGGLLVLVGLIVGPVFAHVGVATADGLAYRAYFIADLFAHMSVVGELAKGLTPPQNPYFPTEPLPYYWSFFAFPATYARLLPTLAVDRGILLTDLVMGGAYAATWYVALRAAGLSALASALAWGIVLLGSSFEGLYFLLEPRRGGPWTAFRYLNVDALTRWRWDLPPVDGLHRLLWYTPQHGLALTAGLLAILISATARAPRLARGVIEGWLLGVALACSSFNGLLLIGAYALAEVARLAAARFRHWRPWLAGRAAAAAAVLAALGLLVALGMIQRDAGEVILRLNPHFLRGPWMWLALTFGAPLVLAPFGVWALGRGAPRLAVGLGALAVVSIAAFLYVDVRGHENTYVSFRTGQFFYVVLAAATAAAIDAAGGWSRARRIGFVALATVAFAAALPTVALDGYNAQDVTNVERSVGGFPWTVHVTPAHLAATAWAKAHLPRHAVMQMDPIAHGRATWALLPAFAERRVGVGLALFEPNPRRFDAAMRDAQVIFRTQDARTAYELCLRYGVQAVWVGPEERAAHGDAAADKFAADPDHFAPLYAAAGVHIYRVRPPARAAENQR